MDEQQRFKNAVGTMGLGQHPDAMRPAGERERIEAARKRAAEVFGSIPGSVWLSGRREAPPRIRRDEWAALSDANLAALIAELDAIAPTVTPAPPPKPRHRRWR